MSEFIAKILSEATKWPAEFKATVGDLLRAGVILPNDYTQGTEWYKTAAGEGSADAQYKMASQYGSKEEHLAWYTLAAEQGHREAQYMLGKSHLYCMASDAKNFVLWLTKAAEQGHIDAAYLLGDVHTSSFGIKEPDSFKSKSDFNTGLPCLVKAAEQGHADAQCKLGRLYLSGVKLEKQRWGNDIIMGIEQNPHKAIPWLLKAAEQKHSVATYLLGCCYSKGAGVEKNDFLAFRYWLDAAGQGDSGAQYLTAWCYENGIGTEQNFDECLRWYITAAIHREERACRKLGCDHTTGSREPPVDVSFHLSWYAEQMGTRDQYCVRDDLVDWFSEAAENGSMAAKFISGLIKIDGKPYGLRTDKEAGFLLFDEAAKHGLYIAEYWVGKCYEEGLGVSPNMELAVTYYWRAAANGFKEAQYSLGRCYQKGLGVSEDYDLSFQMFAKAANQYHRDAASCLGSCGDNAGYFLLGEGYLHNQNATDLCLGYSPVKNTSWCGPGGSEFLKNKLNDIFEWHLNAAKQDSALAQYNAAYFYIHGIGVEQNDAQAVRWLTKAAEAGHTLAQYQLGCFYLRGEGVAMGLKMMVKWFAKASEAGDPIINEAMNKIEEKELWALIEHETHS